MKVTIVIPNYNGKKFLENCIESLYEQDYKNMDIIVVDNGSTDGSIEFIESRYSDVKLIKLDKNYGFSKAVNEGIKEAKGEYVVLLNNDTKTTSNWLQELVNCIDKDENIFSCSSKMLKYDDISTIDDAGDEYTILGWAYQNGNNKPETLYSKPKEVFSSCAGAAIYRKSILDKIGYFDESFFAYLEDVDIGYRARIHGYKNVYCPAAICYHIGSATTGSKYNEFKISLSSRNNIYLLYKNMPLLQLVFNFPFLFIGFFIKWIFFLFKGYGKTYLYGVIQGLRTIHQVQKIKCEKVHLLNYLKIQRLLIINSAKYFYQKFNRK